MTTTNPTSRNAVRTDDQRNGTVSRRSFTETKAGVKTTEMYVAVIAAAAVLIAAYADSDDALNKDDGWLFAIIILTGYVISRGLAKLGSREPYTYEG